MRKQLDLFEAGFNRAILVLAWCVAASIGLIAVLIPLNLFLVKFHLGSLWWLYEAVEYTLYFGVFLGTPWVLQQGAHVRIDVLVSMLKRESAARLERAINLAGAAICAVLCSYGLRAAISEFQDGIYPDKDLRIQTGYMMSVFAISFAMLTIEFLLRLRPARVLVEEETASAGEGF